MCVPGVVFSFVDQHGVKRATLDVVLAVDSSPADRQRGRHHAESSGQVG